MLLFMSLGKQVNKNCVNFNPVRILGVETDYGVRIQFIPSKEVKLVWELL